MATDGYPGDLGTYARTYVPKWAEAVVFAIYVRTYVRNPVGRSRRSRGGKSCDSLAVVLRFKKKIIKRSTANTKKITKMRHGVATVTVTVATPVVPEPLDLEVLRRVTFLLITPAYTKRP